MRAQKAQEEHAAQRCYNYSYLLERGAPWVGGADFLTALPAPALPDQLFAWKLGTNLQNYDLCSLLWRRVVDVGATIGFITAELRLIFWSHECKNTLKDTETGLSSGGNPATPVTAAVPSKQANLRNLKKNKPFVVFFAKHRNK